MLIHRKNKVAKGGFPVTPFSFDVKRMPIGFSISPELLGVFGYGELKPMSKSDKELIDSRMKTLDNIYNERHI